MACNHNYKQRNKRKDRHEIVHSNFYPVVKLEIEYLFFLYKKKRKINCQWITKTHVALKGSNFSFTGQNSQTDPVNSIKRDTEQMKEGEPRRTTRGRVHNP